MTKPLTIKKIKLLRRAADEGKVCGRCGRALDRDEPIYRERWNRDVLYSDRWGAVPVCAGCVGVCPRIGSIIMGRVMLAVALFTRKHFERADGPFAHTCAGRHSNPDGAEIVAEIGVNLSPAPPVAFTPRRKGTITCGNACRQRLHRLRHKSERVTENSLSQFGTRHQALRCNDVFPEVYVGCYIGNGK
jgi:hypothetical protein